MLKYRNLYLLHSFLSNDEIDIDRGLLDTQDQQFSVAVSRLSTLDKVESHRFFCFHGFHFAVP
jgi:hypothetical protein